MTAARTWPQPGFRIPRRGIQRRCRQGCRCSVRTSLRGQIPVIADGRARSGLTARSESFAYGSYHPTDNVPLVTFLGDAHSTFVCEIFMKSGNPGAKSLLTLKNQQCLNVHRHASTPETAKMLPHEIAESCLDYLIFRLSEAILAQAPKPLMSFYRSDDFSNTRNVIMPRGGKELCLST